jgi:hypothetical protein
VWTGGLVLDGVHGRISLAVVTRPHCPTVRLCSAIAEDG